MNRLNNKTEMFNGRRIIGIDIFYNNSNKSKHSDLESFIQLNDNPTKLFNFRLYNKRINSKDAKTSNNYSRGLVLRGWKNESTLGNNCQLDFRGSFFPPIWISDKFNFQMKIGSKNYINLNRVYNNWWYVYQSKKFENKVITLETIREFGSIKVHIV